MLNFSKPESTPSYLFTVKPLQPPVSSKKFNLSTKPINRMFIVIICFFAVCHAITVYFDYGGVTKTPLMKNFAKLFNLNAERGIPNLFSSLILLVSSALLYFNYRVIHRRSEQAAKRPWLILSVIFLFLCFDEALSIHEQLMPVTRNLLGTTLNGFLHWAWVVPYAFLMVGVTAYFWKFVMRLPRTTRKLFFLSCFIYVGGALGLELIEGYTYEKQYYVINEFLVMAQEVMEMAGIALFIHALLGYIRLNAKEITAKL